MWLYWDMFNVMNCTPVVTPLRHRCEPGGAWYHTSSKMDSWCVWISEQDVLWSRGPCAHETQKVISDLLCQLSPSVSQATAVQMVLLLRRVNYTSKCSRSWALNVRTCRLNEWQKKDIACLVRRLSFYCFLAALVRRFVDICLPFVLVCGFTRPCECLLK